MGGHKVIEGDVVHFVMTLMILGRADRRPASKRASESIMNLVGIDSEAYGREYA